MKYLYHAVSVLAALETSRAFQIVVHKATSTSTTARWMSMVAEGPEIDYFYDDQEDIDPEQLLAEIRNQGGDWMATAGTYTALTNQPTYNGDQSSFARESSNIPPPKSAPPVRETPKKQPTTGKWDPSQMSVAQLKTELDTFGVDYSDCHDHQLDLLERWEDVQAHPRNYLSPPSPVEEEPQAQFVPPSPPRQDIPSPPQESSSDVAPNNAPSAFQNTLNHSPRDNLFGSSHDTEPTQNQNKQQVFYPHEGTTSFEQLVESEQEQKQHNQLSVNIPDSQGGSSSNTQPVQKPTKQQVFLHHEGTMSLEQLVELEEEQKLLQQHNQRPTPSLNAPDSQMSLEQLVEMEEEQKLLQQHNRGPKPSLNNPDSQSFQGEKPKTTFFQGVQVEQPSKKRPTQTEVNNHLGTPDQATFGSQQDAWYRNDQSSKTTGSVQGIHVEQVPKDTNPFFDTAFYKRAPKTKDRVQPVSATDNTAARGPDDPFNLPSIEQPYPQPKKPQSKGGYIQDF